MSVLLKLFIAIWLLSLCRYGIIIITTPRQHQNNTFSNSFLCLRIIGFWFRFHWKLLPVHDDIIKWKHFSRYWRYWPFAWGIHRSPVNSPHKGQWRWASMFSLICVWINVWVNNREAGDLRRYRAHCDVTVMQEANIGLDAAVESIRRKADILTYYSEVIMNTMASQITDVSIVYATVCSGAVQRKHQSPAS